MIEMKDSLNSNLNTISKFLSERVGGWACWLPRSLVVMGMKGCKSCWDLLCGASEVVDATKPINYSTTALLSTKSKRIGRFDD